MSKKKPRIKGLKFRKLVLDFQLKAHEEYLEPFIGLFKRIDSDKDGIITEYENGKIMETFKLANVHFSPEDTGLLGK